MNNDILLVDDEEGIRKVLGISLADMGYRVHTAENAEQALEIFAKARPAVVLTDIKMPGMGGIALLKRLKLQEPDTEIIMITGHGDMELAIESLKYEATDFVTKPIHDEVLAIALKRAEERIEMRRKLRQYTENLEQMVAEKTRELLDAERLAAIGQTVAELSHAIKNIVGGLKGGIFVLEKGIELDNRTYLRQGWEMVNGNVDKIKNLTLDLLNFARTSKIECRMGDANEPAEEVFQLMKDRSQRRGIALQAEFSQQLKPVCFDPEGIHRCLLNLVTNAIEACDEEPRTEEKTVVISTAAPGEWGVEYRVRDTGCGMDEEIRKKVFQGFFTTKGARGTGIGLMLTKKIVDEHRGEIAVQSERGVGSTFIIRIPAQSEADVSDPSTRPKP